MQHWLFVVYIWVTLLLIIWCTVRCVQCIITTLGSLAAVQLQCVMYVSRAPAFWSQHTCYCIFEVRFYFFYHHRGKRGRPAHTKWHCHQSSVSKVQLQDARQPWNRESARRIPATEVRRHRGLSSTVIEHLSLLICVEAGCIITDYSAQCHEVMTQLQLTDWIKSRVTGTW